MGIPIPAAGAAPVAAIITAAGVATMAVTTAAVEGITAGDFVREVSSLGMRPESIIPSNTNLLASIFKTLRNPGHDGVAHHPTKALYLTAETDVGGFGIGSEITWQAYGALGLQITRNIFSELGYRYLYSDYDTTSFIFQAAMHGAQITAGITFSSDQRARASLQFKQYLAATSAQNRIGRGTICFHL